MLAWMSSPPDEEEPERYRLQAPPVPRADEQRKTSERERKVQT
jgi:hypothetical protein